MSTVTWAERHAEALRLQDQGAPLAARRVGWAAVEAAGSERERAESSLVVAWVSHRLGDVETSRELVGAARGVVPVVAACVEGVIACAEERFAEAVGALELALSGVLPVRWRANALVASGVAAGALGQYARAERATEQAAELYASLGEHGRAATCLHNLGHLAAQAGDHPLALARYAASGVDERRWPEVLLDQAASHLALGHTAPADAALARAHTLLAASGRAPAYADSLLARARYAQATGDPEATRRAATRALDHATPATKAQAEALIRASHTRPRPAPGTTTLFDDNGTLTAITPTATTNLGPTQAITEAARALHHAATLAIHRPATPTQAATRLFQLLKLPHRTTLIPTHHLADVPWGLLPGDITIAPNPEALDKAQAAPVPTKPHRLWIAGPNLRHATAEATRLHREHGGTLLVNPTVAEALTAIEHATHLHLAAHGTHHPVPAIHLADGPLHPYHLAKLTTTPAFVTLAACEVGNPFGFPRAFLDKTTRTVIGTPLPIRDRLLSTPKPGRHGFAAIGLPLS
ncbi:hypothetical protein [Actinokineospora pegani]|uniref:hypothetical protein n=1 Tax=Actinokineospora pegani TaxID=2654637 RepID=UPI0012EA2089|nr:hypothetical protein [Actinokineospora pegani]